MKRWLIHPQNWAVYPGLVNGGMGAVLPHTLTTTLCAWLEEKGIWGRITGQKQTRDIALQKPRSSLDSLPSFFFFLLLLLLPLHISPDRLCKCGPARLCVSSVSAWLSHAGWMWPDPLQRGLTRSGDISAFLPDYKGSPPPFCSASASSVLHHSCASPRVLSPVSKPGAQRGSGVGELERCSLDGRPHYLSICPTHHWTAAVETKCQRECKVTDSPWMVIRGQVQGPLASSGPAGHCCSAGWSIAKASAH